MSATIEAKGVYYKIGFKSILSNVSFSARPSQILCILGPNGAGKSTLFRHLSGEIKPQTGVLQILGHHPNAHAVKQAMGLTPQDVDFPAHLKPIEILKLLEAFYQDSLEIDVVAKALDLNRLLHRTCAGMSGGEMRRLSLACALIGNPKVILLDEPTTGLDVETRSLLWDAIRKKRSEGATVVLTTHYLEEAEQLGDHFLVLEQGEIVRSGNLTELRGSFRQKKVSFQIPTDEFRHNLRRFCDHYGLAVATNPSSHLYFSGWSSAPESLVSELVQAGEKFSDLEVRSPSLEDIIKQLRSESK